MTDKTKKNYIEDIFNSIGNYVSKEKEEELREKVSISIKAKIFSDEIEECLNSRDFSHVGLLDNSSDDKAFMFSTIFPIFIKVRDATFRLYKHKVEIMLSDDMKDRFVYIFSDGRLTSGEFKCYKLYEDEYVYIIKRIIENIPKFESALKEEIHNLDAEIDEVDKKKDTSKIQLDKAKNNYKLLLDMLK
ncbi:hypothetical protein [Clostridium akagii]|uniref:hypothetical protein n=1 Tax=Clostridium akagii TaxID=91623 RepID=UPI00047B83AF|nr:hypothetical protein [Clostridium akagii]